MMGVVVYIPNHLEGRNMMDDFKPLVDTLNSAAREGMEYLVANKADGDPIALPVHGLVIEMESD